MSCIAFDDITPDSSVRYIVIENVQYLSIRDLIMVMCDKDGNQAGEVWRRLPDWKRSELEKNCMQFKFNGAGQRDQPVITFGGALKLLMFLPGQKAHMFRSKAAEILIRYYAGDKTLLRDVAANAESSAPVNAMARAALEPSQEQVEEDAALERKRKRIELEKEELNMRMKSWELQKSYMENVHKFCSNGQLDERSKLYFKDCILNLSGELCGIARPAIVNGADGAKSPDAPLTISTVAAAKGLRLNKQQLVAVGVKMSGLYRQKYGEAPPKHDQFVDGAVRQVCSYTERDRDLMEHALSQAPVVNE